MTRVDTWSVPDIDLSPSCWSDSQHCAPAMRSVRLSHVRQKYFRQLVKKPVTMQAYRLLVTNAFGPNQVWLAQANGAVTARVEQVKQDKNMVQQWMPSLKHGPLKNK